MRDRVFGIETEYAVIYHPARGERRRPSNLELYQLFEPLLAARVRGLPRAFSLLRSKPGRFLENGSTFHYEATPLDYEHGLIEMASPECRDPWTLLAHERAKDELLEELALAVTERLGLHGYRGEVRIGKNNVDSQGHTFGSHESYWVEDPLSTGRRALLAPLWIGAWLVTLPLLLAVALGTLLVLVGLVGVALAPLAGWLLDAAARLVQRAAPQLARRLALRARRVASAPTRLARRLRREPGWLVRRLSFLEAPLGPAVALHSALHNQFHFRRFHRRLTAFLVTRAVFAGAGAVVPGERPSFRVTQRAPYVRSLARIFTSGDDRPLYESRDAFFRPWSALGRRRRLHLLLADANLCDWALVLRTGTTALVLEAIEAGELTDAPVLRDPLAALRQVSEDPSLRAELALADGARARSVAIQRHYLDAAKRMQAGTPSAAADFDWRERVLAMWEETLDLLEENPDGLADRIDWVAKRTLLRRDVPDDATWDALAQDGARALDAEARSPELGRLRDVAYRALRTDLRYHELGPGGGHRRLSLRGAIASLASAADIAAARRDPPADTRAFARGREIRDACMAGRAGGATWHRIRVGFTRWRWYTRPLEPRATRGIG